MKIIAKLPPREHYRLVKTTETDRGKVDRFVDYAAPAIMIVAINCDPFDGCAHTIVLSEQIEKTDRSQYPYRLDLKVFPSADQGDPAILDREQIKGVFASNQPHPQYGWGQFYAVPTGKTKIWICYSIWRKP